MEETLKIERKLNRLSEDELNEVEDFIDFILKKHRRAIDDETLPEAGMDNYLHDLENYEQLLAEGSIHWSK